MEDDERAQIMINTKNIDSLNCAKGIACIFVILIHCTFPGIVGEMLRAIARFAVSLFFTVTGYFLLDSHGKVTRARILPETNRKKENFLVADYKSHVDICSFFSHIMDIQNDIFGQREHTVWRKRFAHDSDKAARGILVHLRADFHLFDRVYTRIY